MADRLTIVHQALHAAAALVAVDAAVAAVTPVAVEAAAVADNSQIA